ncbi:MAG: DNA replication and repair protein RecF [Thermoanaerobaculia bacterium]|nr:DNA replication and repair protein RecF [Thermoanaerobaculia bacterium]
MLTRLSLRNFRNLATLDLEPGPGFHLLLGGNGAGKTSLLEALYVVATTKSFRTHRLAEAVTHGAPGFELRAEVTGVARRSLELAWWEGVRRRAVNGKEGTLSEHLESLPVVAWTALDAEILTGAPVLRRRLLDRGVILLRPSALGVLTRFREALAAKRELLQRGRSYAEIEPWNEILASSGSELCRLREEQARELGRTLGLVWAEIELGMPPVTVRYRPSCPQALDGPEALAGALARVAEHESVRRQPLLGPQRDELEILWGGHPVRQVASAGERKALSLALVAAQARQLEALGRFALVLLDDADAELAEATLARVWVGFSGAAQLFASSNRPEVWKSLPQATRWTVERGVVTPLNP